MCGVVGLIGPQEAAREAFLGLITLQHRGQDAAGILTHDANGFHQVKNLGLVESVFTRENMESLTGSLAIGHTRYSTIGRGEIGDVQPFLLNFPYGVAMAHNGNIVNCAVISKDLKQKNRRHMLSHSDTEVMMNLLAEGLSQVSNANPNDLEFRHICFAIEEVCSRVNGSFSVVSLIADHGLLAFRDPHGIRPLVWGKKAGGELASGESHMVASESVALNFNGYEIVRNLEPGEVLFIDTKGKVHSRVIDAREPRHCMFEWVYFASPESVIDQIPVYGARIELGRQLAQAVKQEFEKRQIEADIVVPVPETSRIAAIALAEDLKIPYRELLIKNRYIKRTFILDSQEKRKKAVSLKLSPVRSEIEGKKVLLVDDSIVRGTTSKKLIELVRQAGASKVYFVSTCPPIHHPCYYGIDFPSETELVAHGRSPQEIEAELGADAVIYQDIEGLVQSILKAGSGGRMKRPCLACLDGRYPTDVKEGKAFARLRQTDRQADQQADRKEGKA